MRKHDMTCRPTRCVSLIFILWFALAGCAAKQPDERDQFFQNWKATAESSKGYVAKSRKRKIILPPARQMTPAEEQQAGLERRPLPENRITMRMHQTEVAVLLRALTRAVDLNLIINENVAGTVNVDVRETPWNQVFLGILRSQGLYYEWEGDIVRIITLEDKNRSLEQLAVEQKIKQQHKEMEMIEPLLTQVIPIEFADAAKLRENLETFLTLKSEGQRTGSIMVDEHTNSLIVQAIRSDLEKMIPLIMELDRPTPQILIEAHIVEATKDTAMELGVQWGGLIKENDVWVTPGVNSSGAVGNPLSAGGVDPTSGWAVNFPNAGGSGTAGAFTGFSLGLVAENVGQSILAAQLSALQTEGKINILSSPSITTLDNQQAVIESGNEVPYQTVENGEVKIEYKKAVLSLEVTPHVIGENALKLNINTSKDELDFANAVAGQPSILTKKAQTNVLLYDGQTTVIGGLSKEKTDESESGIPWLKNIPVLGYLFKGKRTQNQLDELLIFITPHILGEELVAEETDLLQLE